MNTPSEGLALKSEDLPLTSRGATASTRWKEAVMFKSLSEQMKHDEARETTTGERVAKWTVVAVAAVVLFGGLYFAIQVLA